MTTALGGATMAFAQAAAESAILNATAGARVGAVAPTPSVKLARATTSANAAGAATDSGPSCIGGMLEPTEVRLGAGRSMLLNMPEPVVRRTLGDPLVVDSQLVSPQVLYLAAGRIGSTNAILQGKSGRCTVLSIVVGIDVDAVQAKLSELLPDETGIKVTSAADSLVLNGTVRNALASEQAVAVANAYVRSAYQQGIPQAGGGQASDIDEKALAGGRRCWQGG